MRIKVSTEDSVAISPREGPLLPLLGTHSLGATGVKDHDLDRNTMRLGKKGLTLTWKKQAIEVGGEVAVDSVGPDG